GIFGSPAGEEMLLAWAIPALAAAAALAAGCLWLAGEVSFLAAGGPSPGNPAGYLRRLAAGRGPWPDTWGWLAVAVASSAMAVITVFAVRTVTARWMKRHRADEVAGHIARRADRLRLGERARARESARLSPDARDWAGSPLGLIIPGRHPAFS